MAISFKQEAISSIPWIPYSIAGFILIIILWMLTKHTAKENSAKPGSKILESFAINHKTKAYILEYQGQQFLIAENQQAIAIHEVKSSESLS